MADETELVRLLRLFETTYEQTRGMPWIGTVRPEQAFKRAADTIEALQREREWRPIETIPPNEAVLVADERGCVDIASYNPGPFSPPTFVRGDDRCQVWRDAGTIVRGPTDWRPVPEGPRADLSGEGG